MHEGRERAGYRRHDRHLAHGDVGEDDRRGKREEDGASPRGRAPVEEARPGREDGGRGDDRRDQAREDRLDDAVPEDPEREGQDHAEAGDPDVVPRRRLPERRGIDDEAVEGARVHPASRGGDVEDLVVEGVPERGDVEARGVVGEGEDEAEEDDRRGRQDRHVLREAPADGRAGALHGAAMVPGGAGTVDQRGRVVGVSDGTRTRDLPLHRRTFCWLNYAHHVGYRTGGIRTHDLSHPKRARSLLRHGPKSRMLPAGFAPAISGFGGRRPLC